MQLKHPRTLLATVLALAVLCVLSLHLRPGSAQRHSGTDTYAITNARIVTVSGLTIDRGTVVIRDGLIAQVAGNITAPPPDARVIDGAGLTVYPGIIDANSTLGIPRPSPIPGTTPGGLAALFAAQNSPSAVSPNSTQLPGMQPEILASDLIKTGGPEIEAARNVGITTTQTAPRGNVFLGQSAVINLAGDSPQQMIVRSPVALYVGLSPLGGGNYPGSLMGVFSSVRQMLLDAGRYREANDAYARNPRGMKRPEADKSLAALQPVLEGRMAIVMQADREREIDRALELAREFNVHMIINGGMEADRAAARLKAMNVPVLLSVNFPKRTAAASAEADPEPLRLLRERVEAPKTAGRLAAAGVRFAFQSGGMTSINDFLTNVAKAVENGVSREDAVRALTYWPAQMLGVSAQLGSIEAGKIANLTITRGDLFDKNSRIAYVFIDGRPVDLKPATPSPERGAAAAGNWSLTISLSGSGNEKQEFTGTLALQQQGERLTGSIQGQLGSGSITNGTVTGTDVNFTVPITLSAGSQTTDAIFAGSITGNQMRGTVQIVGRGAGTFIATRAAAPAPAASPTPESSF